MAKVISPFKLRGSLGGLVYYENEYGPQVREKGGPPESRVKTHERFANTRRNAAEWKRATAAAKLFREAMGPLLKPVKNIRLSGSMNGVLLAALRADPVHDKGERVVASGNLSLFKGFEFNHKLSLEDALPVNIENCFSLEAGKLALDVPAFRLRHKKGLPKDATHYRLVSCMLSIDFDKGTFQRDIQASELQAMGRKAGAAFCIEQTVQPSNEQGCFWLMGIGFYKMVNEQPVLVSGGALRVMEWIGKAGVDAPAEVVKDVVKESLKAVPEVVGTTTTAASFVDEVIAVAYVDEEKLEEIEAIGEAYREAMLGEWMEEATATEKNEAHQEGHAGLRHDHLCCTQAFLRTTQDCHFLLLPAEAGQAPQSRTSFDKKKVIKEKSSQARMPLPPKRDRLRILAGQRHPGCSLQY